VCQQILSCPDRPVEISRPPICACEQEPAVGAARYSYKAGYQDSLSHWQQFTATVVTCTRVNFSALIGGSIGRRSWLQRGLWLAMAIVAALSMWFYFDRILAVHQIIDAAEYRRPRGNLSDLYPRWLGARELLLHHINPYSDKLTVEIQKGYYGRALDPSKPNDPRDQQRFAYPVYVVFLLAPSIWLPFHDVRILFHWTLVLVTAGSVWLWLRTLRWSLSCVAIVAAIALMLGNVPAVQGIKVQQLSLIVAGLLALAVACISEGYLFATGVLLALATIKPQLACVPVAALLVWVISDWRKRRGLAIGFLVAMVTLLVGAEILLPGWWTLFSEAVRQYHRYTQNQSVIEVTLSEVFGVGHKDKVAHLVAEGLSVAALVASGIVMWKWKKVDATHPEFGTSMALTLALTVLVVPMYAPYNQVLLLPGVLVLAKERREFLAQAGWRRTAFAIGVAILVCQWIASIGLVFIYFLISHERALQGWTWPFFGTFAFPLWIFGLIFIHLRAQQAPEL
jgi:hypothetical protein